MFPTIMKLLIQWKNGMALGKLTYRANEVTAAQGQRQVLQRHHMHPINGTVSPIVKKSRAAKGIVTDPWGLTIPLVTDPWGLLASCSHHLKF